MLKLNNKNKLLYSIFALLFLGLIASACVAYYEVRRNLYDALQKEQLLKAEAANNKLSLWLSQNHNLVADLASTMAESGAPLRENPDYLFYLRQTLKSSDFYYLYYGLEADGYSLFGRWQKPEDYDPRSRPWYLASKTAKTPVITKPYYGLNEPRNLYIAMTAPIIRHDQFLGVVSGDLSLDYVRRTILNIKFDLGGFAFLTDADGRIIIHPNEELVDEVILELPGLEKIGSIFQHAETKTLYAAEENFYFAYPIEHSELYLVFSLPRKPVSSQIVGNTIELLALFLAIFIIIFSLLYAVNRHLFLPLMKFLEMDRITGLPSKKSFKQDVTDQNLNPGQDGMLLIISIDDFNPLTAAFPTTARNELLQQVSDRIENLIGHDATLGVFSESRFIAYLPNHDQFTERQRILQLEELNDTLNRSYRIAENKFNCVIRIGASFFPQHGEDIEQLIDKAFAVMALAKKQQTRDFGIYSPDIDHQLSNDLLIASAMRNALENQEFHMVYQPQYDLEKQTFCCLESLIRWDSTELGRNVPPNEFIPVAEASDLIIELGYAIIDMVAFQLSQWQKQGLSFRRVSINISPKQLRQPDFQNKLENILRRYKVANDAVELELTETTLLKHPEESIRILESLQDSGFSIAIDDFGTGYSSLQYLTQIPFSKLKVDRAFISDLEQKRKNQLIIKMLSELAAALNFTLLAEGAETEAESALLEQIGCHMIQGYYHARPMTVDQIEQFIRPTVS